MPLPHSVVDYDDRGPWGSTKFPGNTSGYIIKDLIETYGAKVVYDPMMGSDTTGDVCRSIEDIDYLGQDIDNGDDMLARSTQNEARKWADAHGGIDLIFWHPPYWDMYVYHRTDPRDFSSGKYITYLVRMQRGLEFLRTMLSETPRESTVHPRLAILIGDMRSRGRYYWIVRDILEPRKLAKAHWKLDALVIKRQRAVSSNFKFYATNKPLVRIMHEYVAILEPT